MLYHFVMNFTRGAFRGVALWIARIFVLFVECSYCGRKFKSLGPHIWRSKEKLKTAENTNNVSKIRSALNNSTLSVAIKDNRKVCNCSHVKCCCIKLSTVLRGLHMHQRSCRVLIGQTYETFELLDETEYTDTGQNFDSID